MYIYNVCIMYVYIGGIGESYIGRGIHILNQYFIKNYTNS